MLIRDLINKLEALDHEHYQSGANEVMGPATIETDVFVPVIGSTEKHYYYAGFDHEICIERSGDGVYLLLNKFARRDPITVTKPQRNPPRMLTNTSDGVHPFHTENYIRSYKAYDK